MVVSISTALLLGVGVGWADQAPAGGASENGLVRVDALIGQGRIDQAFALLQELAQKDPETPGLESKLGKVYYEKRHWGEAVTHLELALKENPGDGEATQLLGLSYFMNGKLKEAIPLLEKVQSLLPHPDATASYLVGVACIQTYQYDKARVAFAHMFSLPPDSAAALEAVAKARVRFQIGHMRRYDPAYAEAMKRIEAGEIGEPVIFKSIGRDAEVPPPVYFESGWTGTLLHDSSVHEFDLARWLMNDEVAEVHAYAGARAHPELTRLNLFDSGVVNLRFVRGAIGNVAGIGQAPQQNPDFRYYLCRNEQAWSTRPRHLRR
jgi:tetratricopeptide (TPR) repeat protein